MSDLSQDSVLTSGEQYLVTLTVSNYAAGSVKAIAGSAAGTNRYGNGTYEETLTANGESFIIQADAAFQGDIDNVRVKLSLIHI